MLNGIFIPNYKFYNYKNVLAQIISINYIQTNMLILVVITKIFGHMVKQIKTLVKQIWLLGGYEFLGWITQELTYFHSLEKIVTIVLSLTRKSSESDKTTNEDKTWLKRFIKEVLFHHDLQSLFAHSGASDIPVVEDCEFAVRHKVVLKIHMKNIKCICNLVRQICRRNISQIVVVKSQSLLLPLVLSLSECITVDRSSSMSLLMVWLSLPLVWVHH